MTVHVTVFTVTKASRAHEEELRTAAEGDGGEVENFREGKITLGGNHGVGKGSSENIKE